MPFRDQSLFLCFPSFFCFYSMHILYAILYQKFIVNFKLIYYNISSLLKSILFIKINRRVY